MVVNYSLYLVTDSTPAIIGTRDVVQIVDEATQGGVTIVQYRDKTSDTADLIRVGKRLHEVTKRNNVPLLVNDRIDVALAIGAEGVHIGQDDMDLRTARKLLGAGAIVGVTASNLSDAIVAAGGGASYLGIGTVYASATKADSKSIIGPSGVRNILQRVSSVDQTIPTVAIGGLKASNIQRIMFQSRSSTKGLDGVAVVSAIMAAHDPRAAASKLREAIDNLPTTMSPKAIENMSIEGLLDQIPSIVKTLGQQSPLCHNMTNLVVQNFAANVAICIGASPIMANYGEEAADLAGLGGALVVNMGTVTPDGLANYTQAIQAYNEIAGPVLLDPVGAGATAVRRSAVKALIGAGYFDVIKGNENEIATVLGEGMRQQKGVDSGASTSDDTAKARMVKKLAARERNVVLMTGSTDFLSDGDRTFAIKNGHEYLGSITGSGCTLGTAIASFQAVHKEDRLLAALAGILMFEIAAELAAERADVRGPGTFVPAFLDELYGIAKRAEQDDAEWLQRARVEKVDTKD
ncbi:MAG: hypothetical protein Q9164_006527 [Protoblastenia rupestris]